MIAFIWLHTFTFWCVEPLKKSVGGCFCCKYSDCPGPLCEPVEAFGGGAENCPLTGRLLWPSHLFRPFLRRVHSEVGQDFLLRRRVTLTETAVTRKRKVEKWIRRCQNFRLREGYKRAIDEIRGPIAKNGFSGKNPKILAKKKRSLLNSNHVPATTGQCCPKKKYPFPKWLKDAFRKKPVLSGKNSQVGSTLNFGPKSENFGQKKAFTFGL